MIRNDPAEVFNSGAKHIRISVQMDQPNHIYIRWFGVVLLFQAF